MKTPSGRVQQSPWMGIANKQLGLMGRYMTEFGMTPASRSRIAALDPRMEAPKRIEVKWLSSDRGSARERLADELDRRSRTITVELDEGDASVL